MDDKSIRKLTLFINTVILILVLGLMLFFYLCKADFLVYFSIPTMIVYIIGYMIIFKRNLQLYVHMVYFWLTGLYNRRYMMEQLSGINDFADSAAVAIIDIDDFKKINDIYGHNAGDYVLSNLASIMRSSCKDTVISRWGGEEFLILAKNTEDFRERMELLRKKVEAFDFLFEKNRIAVTVTVGYAIKDGTQSIDKWIQRADEKLYYGKNNGKNAVIG